MPILDEINAENPHIECLFFLRFRNEEVKSTTLLKRQNQQVFAPTSFLSHFSSIFSHVKVSNSAIKFQTLLPTSRKAAKRFSVPRLWNVFNCLDYSCFQLVNVFRPAFTESAPGELLLDHVKHVFGNVEVGTFCRIRAW